MRKLKLQQDLKAETVKKHSNALHNKYRVKAERGNLTLPSKALAWLQEQAAETTTTNDGDNDQ